LPCSTHALKCPPQNGAFYPSMSGCKKKSKDTVNLTGVEANCCPLHATGHTLPRAKPVRRDFGALNIDWSTSPRRDRRRRRKRLAWRTYSSPRRKICRQDPTAPNCRVPLYWPAPQMVLSTRKGMHRFSWDLHFDPIGDEPREGGGATRAVPHRTYLWPFPSLCGAPPAFPQGPRTSRCESSRPPRMLFEDVDGPMDHNGPKYARPGEGPQHGHENAEAQGPMVKYTVPI